MNIKVLKLCGTSIDTNRISSFDELVSTLNNSEYCISNKSVTINVCSLTMQYFPQVNKLMSSSAWASDRMRMYTMMGTLEFEIIGLPRAGVLLNEFFESINMVIADRQLVNANTGRRGKYNRSISLHEVHWQGLVKHCEHHIMLQKLNNDSYLYHKYEYQEKKYVE